MVSIQLGELFLEGNILMEEEFWLRRKGCEHTRKTRPKNRVVKFKRAVCLSYIGEDWPATKAAFMKSGAEGRVALRSIQPNQKLPPIDAWLWPSAEHRLMEFDAAKAHVTIS